MSSIATLREPAPDRQRREYPSPVTEPSRVIRVLSGLTVLFVIILFGACAASQGQVADSAEGAAERVQQSNPPAPKLELTEPVVNISGAFRLGKSDAAIGILEFSDLQCPYCRDFHVSLLPRLKEIYVDTGIAQYIYKDYPLRMHREAVPAALAARCAGAQGKYWLMQDRLFANQEHLGGALYRQLAQALELDAKQFESCLSDRAQLQGIYRDLMQGRHLGVSATPTIMLGRVDGDFFTVLRVAKGTPDLETFMREIEKLRTAP